MSSASGGLALRLIPCPSVSLFRKFLVGDWVIAQANPSKLSDYIRKYCNHASRSSRFRVGIAIMQVSRSCRKGVETGIYSDNCNPLHIISQFGHLDVHFSLPCPHGRQSLEHVNGNEPFVTFLRCLVAGKDSTQNIKYDGTSQETPSYTKPSATRNKTKRKLQSCQTL